jgi:hypothetical protein
MTIMTITPKKPAKPDRTALADSTDYDTPVYHTNGAFIGDFRERNGSKVRLHLFGRDHWADRDNCEVGQPQPAQPAKSLREWIFGF